MSSIKVNLVILTYHIDNLVISTKNLNYLPYELNIIIHNDNPDVTLDPELSKMGNIYRNGAILINEPFNQGMLKSRLRCIPFLDRTNEFTIFLDDDDILLPVEFESSYSPKQIINISKITKVNELVNYLINNKIPFSTIEERYGVSGNIYNTEYLIEWYGVLCRFMPTIKDIFGTDIINAGEDDIFDRLSYEYFHHKYSGSYATKLDQTGMIWNQIESPLGRYSIVDSRYGDQNLSNSFNSKFDKLLQTFKDYIE